MPRLPAPNSAAAEVRRLMRRLNVADLVAIGGEDLRSADPVLRERARHVARCWSRMARLGLTLEDLETDR
jgi:hypothetical protein